MTSHYVLLVLALVMLALDIAGESPWRHHVLSNLLAATVLWEIWRARRHPSTLGEASPPGA